MDTQTLEIVGRHRLAGELLQAGLEVAFPARDRGIDLIAYRDVDPEGTAFVARPIQMKAASRRSFGIFRKYEKFHGMLLVFVWHLDGQGRPETYALTYAEALAVGEERGWTDTPSWVKRGEYENTQPGRDVRRLLEPYLMTPERWLAKVVSNGTEVWRSDRSDEKPDDRDRFVQPADGIEIVQEAWTPPLDAAKKEVEPRPGTAAVLKPKKGGSW